MNKRTDFTKKDYFDILDREIPRYRKKNSFSLNFKNANRTVKKIIKKPTFQVEETAADKERKKEILAACRELHILKTTGRATDNQQSESEIQQRREEILYCKRILSVDGAVN